MFLDRILKVFFLIGFFSLSFTLGACWHYNKWPGSTALTKAFLSGSFWIEATFAPDRNPPPDNVTAMKDHLSNATVQWNKDEAYSGYTLLVTPNSTVFLLDMDGRPVHQWNIPFNKAWPNPTHVHGWAKPTIYITTAYAFPNGDLIAQYEGKTDTPYGYGLVKVDKNANVLWTYSQNAHHDFYIADDESIYAVVHQFIEGSPSFRRLSYPLLADYIAKLTPEGKEIERISILDAFAGTPFVSLMGYENSTIWDHIHTNSVMVLEPSMAKAFPQFKAGDLLVSLRNMNGIAVIDHITHKVIWAKVGPWKRQHSATFMPNGHILLFDNKGKGLRWSRLVEWDPVNDEMAWTYGGKGQAFLSITRGRAQLLPNDNRFFVSSHQMRMIEITAKGQVVWEYRLPESESPGVLMNVILDARRYGKDALPFLQNTDQGK